jgi:hypothetical protein
MDTLTIVLLDFSKSNPYNNKVNKFKQMSLTAKFKKDIQTLRSAANGESYLDVKNPKLYKKVRRFYESNGVIFSGDPLDDYEILMEYIYSDLEAEGALVS